ncbi:MAG: CPBP family intramembrane glutamic endopeptidase [Gemmatimonadota bacterium]
MRANLARDADEEMILRHPLPTFFTLACAISWLIWAPLWLPRFGVHGLPVVPFHHALGAFGPIAAAFIVSRVEAGRAGPADLLRRMGLWHNRTTWLAVALCGPFAMLAVAILAAWLLGAASFSRLGFGVSSEFPQFAALGFLVYNVLTFRYGEETGWRGFALPRLQARHGAFVSSLLLTAGWALWHVPLFLYRPGYVVMGVAGILGWLFSLLTGAVLLTWVYNESRGSILVVALFHATVDVAFTSNASSPFIVNAAGTILTVFGIVVVLVAGPRYLSRKGMVVRSNAAGRVIDFVDRDGVVHPEAA